MGVVNNEIRIAGIEANTAGIMTSVASCIEAVNTTMTSVNSLKSTVGDNTSGLVKDVNDLKGAVNPVAYTADQVFSDLATAGVTMFANSIAYKVGKIAILDVTLQKSTKWTHGANTDIHVTDAFKPVGSVNQVVTFGEVSDSALVDSGHELCYVFINNSNGTTRIHPYGSSDYEYLHFSAVYITA